MGNQEITVNLPTNIYNLSDDPDIDTTGSSEMGAVLHEKLAALSAAGWRRVILGAGRYQIGSVVSIPELMSVEFPARMGYEVPAEGQAVFSPAHDGDVIFRMVGDYSRIKGLAFDLSQKDGAIAIRPERHFEIIEGCSFRNGAPTAFGIHGGGVIKLDVHYNAWYDFAGRCIELLNAHANDPNNSYYGVDEGVFAHNVFGGLRGVQMDGIFAVEHNDFQALYVNPALILGGGSNTFVIVVDNYFEILGAVCQGIFLHNETQATIIGNQIYARGGKPAGSAGIKFENYAHSTRIEGNMIAHFDVGIDHYQVANAPNSSGLLFDNDFDDCNTRITWGYYNKPTVGYPSDPSGAVLAMDPDRGMLVSHAALVSTIEYYADHDGATIDLRLANQFDLDFTEAVTLTVIGAVPGMRFVLKAMKNTVTLPESTFHLREKKNVTMKADEQREFTIDHNLKIQQL